MQGPSLGSLRQHAMRRGWSSTFLVPLFLSVNLPLADAKCSDTVQTCEKYFYFATHGDGAAKARTAAAFVRSRNEGLCAHYRQSVEYICQTWACVRHTGCWGGLGVKQREDLYSVACTDKDNLHCIIQ